MRTQQLPELYAPAFLHTLNILGPPCFPMLHRLQQKKILVVCPVIYELIFANARARVRVFQLSASAHTEALPGLQQLSDEHAHVQHAAEGQSAAHKRTCVCAHSRSWFSFQLAASTALQLLHPCLVLLPDLNVKPSACQWCVLLRQVSESIGS